MIPRNIYMTGIGGIGMSALAQMLAKMGKSVAGSDREESPITELLRAHAIRIDIGQRAENVPEDAELLIYSDAVPESNPERMRAKERGINEMSYFEALGAISQDMRTIAVAGTHGKTTTAGMLAKILQAAGAEPTAVIGSIVKDFGSNFLAGSNDLFVVEACEYRDHVLNLSPEILVITNIELDHTDYFPTIEALVGTFRKAAERVPRGGRIVCDPAGANVARAIATASARIVDYTREAVGELPLIGEFNRQNARAAAAAAKVACPDLRQGTVDRALSDFKGSWRRFEYKGETPSGALVYDDYAHHPTAVAKTIEAAREKFPGKRIIVAFHPHLYSRTKSFLAEFAASLACADLAIVAPIYAAREAPDPSVSSHILADEVIRRGGHAKALDSFGEIREELLQEGGNTLIVTMGAGDIYKVAEQLTD